MDGDADQLSRAGSTRLPALTQFVKMGGKLVITQPAERGKVEALEPLLPIQLKDAGGNWLLETRERNNLRPLREWAKPLSKVRGAVNPWIKPVGEDRTFGPFKVAHVSTVKPGAMVVEYIDWNSSDGPEAATKDLSPFLVRWGVGLGQVTWVAQNLGDGMITRVADEGWIGVWDKVLDLKSDPVRYPKQGDRLTPDQDTAKENFEGGALGSKGRHLGRQYLEGIEHSARGAGLVVLAIGFFILYWAAAGPISYFVLANKKKKGASWPIFGLSAIVATLLTVGVVKLVMGADANVKHVSFVRWAPGQPAVVESRVGVYLTKSNVINVSLLDTDPDSASYVAAFNPHPGLGSSADAFVGQQKYGVWVSKDDDQTPTSLNVPFRSTLKKLQARWSGEMNGIDGKATLTDPMVAGLPSMSGRLTNSTGRDLRNVYFALTVHKVTGEGKDEERTREDWVFYMPAWAKDKTIDLNKDLTGLPDSQMFWIKSDSAITSTKYALPGENKVLRGKIPDARVDDDWTKFWASSIRTGDSTGDSIGGDGSFQRSFPLASLYDRVPPIKNTGLRENNKRDRYDLKRLGIRKIDMSQSVAAGGLVILAQDAANDADGKQSSPLPYPLEVDGEKLAGTGVTFYQFALPLARVAPPPTTQPTSQPTTNKATDTAVEK
jgi:hypothetical protein